MRTVITLPDGQIIGIDDKDIVNFQDYDFYRDKGSLFLFHNEYGFLACAVIGDNLADAMDLAVDNGKFASLAMSQEELKETNEDQITYLGNDTQPFDITNLGVLQIPLPIFSIAALYAVRPKPDWQGVSERPQCKVYRLKGVT